MPNVPLISAEQPILRLDNVAKLYKQAAGDFYALKAISLELSRGEFLAVVGKSGSGKSTLLNIMTGIDRPSSGEVIVSGVNLNELSENKLAVWRGMHLGIVFQFFQLMPTLTVAENVMLPMDFCNSYPRNERRDRARALLEQVYIADQADKFPSALSGGQQQRVAIARALANNPDIIVADEPTGNLDTATANEVIGLFKTLSEAGKTVIVVTHEQGLASSVNRTVTLRDGQLAAPETELIRV